MAIKDLVAVLHETDRIRVIKGGEELYMGYIGNFIPYEAFTRLKDKTVKRFYHYMELRHKRYRELGLTAPMHPEQKPNCLFSDMQITCYYTIEI